MKQEKILQTVRKLLALSHDNPNDNEGQSAMLQAQRLLAKHDMSMDDVAIDDVGTVKKEVVEGDGTDWTRLQWWQKSLANIIAENFRCYNYMKGGNGKRKMVFLGVKADVEIATEVYRFAIADIKFQSKHYMKNRKEGSRAVQNAIKNDYITGYLQGLKKKFQDQVSKEGWGLVLVKDGDVVERYNNMSISTERTRSRTTMSDNQAFGQGFKDGKSFNGSTKSLSY